MSTTTITPKDTTICIDCFIEVSEVICHLCREYKTIMTVGEWEQYTGETYDE
jgi:hypothetical protein